MIEAAEAAVWGAGSGEALQFLMSCRSSKPRKSESILQGRVGLEIETHTEEEDKESRMNEPQAVESGGGKNGGS